MQAASQYNRLIESAKASILDALGGLVDGNDDTDTRLELMWIKCGKALDDLKMPEGGVP
jgi:hypothetical protein